MLQRLRKSGSLGRSLMTGAFLVASGILIGGVLFDVISSSRWDGTPLQLGLTGQDPRGTVVASNRPEPFAVPHSGLDAIWNHFQR